MPNQHVHPASTPPLSHMDEETNEISFVSSLNGSCTPKEKVDKQTELIESIAEEEEKMKVEMLNHHFQSDSTLNLSQSFHQIQFDLSPRLVDEKLAEKELTDVPNQHEKPATTLPLPQTDEIVKATAEKGRQKTEKIEVELNKKIEKIAAEGMKKTEKLAEEEKTKNEELAAVIKKQRKKLEAEERKKIKKIEAEVKKKYKKIEAFMAKMEKKLKRSRIIENGMPTPFYKCYKDYAYGRNGEECGFKKEQRQVAEEERKKRDELEAEMKIKYKQLAEEEEQQKEKIAAQMKKKREKLAAEERKKREKIAAAEERKRSGKSAGSFNWCPVGFILRQR